jgi:hypothetical protein
MPPLEKLTSSVLSRETRRAIRTGAIAPPREGDDPAGLVALKVDCGLDGGCHGDAGTCEKAVLRGWV